MSDLRTDLRTELRAATSASHTAIESNPRLSRLLSASLNFDAYIDVLSRYFGFFKPLEQALASRMRDFGISDFGFKTPALVRDLQGVELSSLPLATDLPPLSSRGSVFGVMYVLEGSALGGLQIARHLSGFPFTEGRRSFFVANGAEVSARWKAFLERLSDVPSSEWPDACSSAARTFSLLDRWMAGS